VVAGADAAQQALDAAPIRRPRCGPFPARRRRAESEEDNGFAGEKWGEGQGTARLTLTAGELERLRQAVEALRRAGETGLSQAEFNRRAVLAEVDRELGAAGPRPARKKKA
jgi:hypothetical protein